MRGRRTVPRLLCPDGTGSAPLEYNKIRNKHRRTIMYQMIPVRRLDQFLDQGFSGTIIDLRSPEEYRRFHLKGAVNRELEELLNQPEEIDRTLPVLFYCSRGSESLRAAVCFPGWDIWLSTWRTESSITAAIIWRNQILRLLRSKTLALSH